eukprot:Partr_v1_DN26775_c0_g1_i2_m9051 putative amidohydrolase domain containing 1
MPKSFKLRVKNIGQLVRICANGERMKRGRDEMNDLAIINDAAIIVDQDGRIAWVGAEADVQKQEWFNDAVFDEEFDASGLSIIPGLVDGHTHPVWDGDRVHEYELKLAGATYMDIHKAGGGIGFTVSKTRESSESRLSELLHGRLGRMLKFGTTFVEAKSGYGLETETEMKMLRVLHRAKSTQPVGISATYLGAHSVPKGMKMSEYAKSVVEEQIPAMVELIRKGEISPENIDVFHEAGVFESSETEAILRKGMDAGLKVNFHGDELHPMQSGELGARLEAHAISHLEEISDEGIAQMANKNVVAVLLPTTAYVLRITCPPARKMIEAGT